MRKVSYARLHAGIEAPGLTGPLGHVFPPNGGKTIHNLEMTYDVEGLHLRFSYQSKSVYLLVPAANVQFVSVVPEEVVSKPLKVVNA